MSAQRKQPNNVRSMLKTEIQEINLGVTEYAEITLTDRDGNEVAKIEFDRSTGETPQLQVIYFDKSGNIKQAITTFDINA